MAVAGFAGSALGAAGTYLGGVQQEKMAEYNAAVMMQRAKATRQAMESETRLMAEGARRTTASQTAAYAKSGASISGGTPLLVLAEQAGKMQLDILEHRRNRMIEEQQYKSQAELLRIQGKQAKMAGTIGAVSTILGGGAKAGMSLMGGTFGYGKSGKGSTEAGGEMLDHIDTLPTFRNGELVRFR